MINQRRYVLIEVSEVTQQMRDNTIPFGIGANPRIANLNGALLELLKWRNDKPVDLWNEYPVYSNQEIIYILTDDLNAQSPL